MKLGTFSVSLAVKNLKTSREFYEAIGFSVFHGDENQKWLIMRNENVTIGLFQGMFEKNILTFNPGWDENCDKLESFMDVREIQSKLIKDNFKLSSTVKENTSGAGSFTLCDPDGNVIMFDQHV